jgi:hypothetical protein
MLQMFHLDVSKVDLVLHVLLCLYMHVLSVCFKCFICFRVSFGCFKEAHAAASVSPWITMPPWVTACLLVLLLLRACGRVKRSGLEVVLTHAWACAASGVGWVRVPGS